MSTARKMAFTTHNLHNDFNHVKVGPPRESSDGLKIPVPLCNVCFENKHAITRQFLGEIFEDDLEG
mgnify:CR=1 FL=1